MHKTNKPVVVAVNKVDKNSLINDSLEFYNLGFENLFSISAINGSGTGDLLDELVNDFTDDDTKSDVVPARSLPKEIAKEIDCFAGQHDSTAIAFSARPAAPLRRTRRG